MSIIDDLNADRARLVAHQAEQTKVHADAAARLVDFVAEQTATRTGALKLMNDHVNKEIARIDAAIRKASTPAAKK